MIKNALILCPASLIQNWKQEFKKWLGEERLKVFTFDDGKDANEFIAGNIYQVFICGYEKVF